VRRVPNVFLKPLVLRKVAGMRRDGESFSDVVARVFEEVESYREETKFALMNKVMHE